MKQVLDREESRSRVDGEESERLLAAMPARTRRREVAVGLFVLAGAIAVLIALFVLTDAATFRGRYHVMATVDDAGGIRRGDPVQMRGVNIGRVYHFVISADGVAIDLELEGEYELPRDSRVVLRSNGLLGGLVADMVPGTSPERLEGGDTIRGLRTEGLFDQAGEIGGQAGEVLGRVEMLLSDETVGALGGGARELEQLLREIRALAEAERKELVGLTASLSRTAAGLEQATAGPELERIVTRLDSLTANAQATSGRLDDASRALASILGRMERGEGTLGRLSRDDALYRNLNQAAENLDLLIQDFKANPKRYIDVSVF